MLTLLSETRSIYQRIETAPMLVSSNKTDRQFRWLKHRFLRLIFECCEKMVCQFAWFSTTIQPSFVIKRFANFCKLYWQQLPSVTFERIATSGDASPCIPPLKHYLNRFPIIDRKANLNLLRVARLSAIQSSVVGCCSNKRSKVGEQTQRSPSLRSKHGSRH